MSLRRLNILYYTQQRIYYDKTSLFDASEVQGTKMRGGYTDDIWFHRSGYNNHLVIQVIVINPELGVDDMAIGVST